MPFITAPFTKKYLRIISTVPSQTELLFSLGLDKEVVGITKFCVHPHQWFTSKSRIGGTKNLNLKLIKELEPDLIIANKEENIKEQIEKLAETYDVYLSDINTLEHATHMILTIGSITGKVKASQEISEKIKKEFYQLKYSGKKQQVVYLIWKDPYMAAGGDTFINDMIERCGFINVFKNKMRYPEVTIDEIKYSGCQFILLSTEPYPFKEKHIEMLRKDLPDVKVILADGEFFSWYGSRLLLAPSYFIQLKDEYGIK